MVLICARRLGLAAPPPASTARLRPVVAVVAVPVFVVLVFVVAVFAVPGFVVPVLGESLPDLFLRAMTASLRPRADDGPTVVVFGMR